MCPILSMPPKLTSMPLQGSLSIIASAASATQVSPPRCAGSSPGTKRFPSSGYMHAGQSVLVP